MRKYKCYQDYCIKDGQLVAEYQEMYKDFDDPWEQSIRENYALEEIVGLELM